MSKKRYDSTLLAGYQQDYELVLLVELTTFV